MSWPPCLPASCCTEAVVPTLCGRLPRFLIGQARTTARSCRHWLWRRPRSSWGATAMLCDLPTAEAALTDAERFAAESARVFQLWVALARPWVAAARGELSAAVGLALSLAEQAEDQGQITFQVLALHDVARLGQP